MVSWPVGALQGSFSQWQEENAQNVINQAQKTLQADFRRAAFPAMHTEVRHGNDIAQLHASRDA